MRKTVARPGASAWARLMIVAAICGGVQPLVGRSCSWVLLVASATTATRASGGKAPGPAGARGVLQAVQAVGGKAFAPLTDGVAVAVEFVGDGLVSRVVGIR